MKGSGSVKLFFLEIGQWPLDVSLVIADVTLHCRE